MFEHAIVKYERTISVLEDSGFEEYIILINNTITKIQEEIKRCEEQTQKEEQERKEALKRKKEKEERERRRVEALRVERDNLTKEKDRLSTELKDYEKRINEGRLKEKEKLEKIQEDIRLLNLDSEEAELRISNKTQSEMELNELESQIDELKQKLSSLGLFAGKQKKQINAMQERINILPSRIEMEKESNKKEADNIRKCNTERINRLTTETLQIQQETEDCENILNEKKQKTNEQYNKVVKRIEEINQELSVVNI